MIAGDDGVIMVDTQFAPLHDKIKAAVAQLSDQPIRYVVNTHLHGDHTGGNQAFWLDGVTLVAHTNLRRSLAEGTTNAPTGAETPPARAAALPARTYTSGMTLSVRGRRARTDPHAGGAYSGATHRVGSPTPTCWRRATSSQSAGATPISTSATAATSTA